jgi:hypothetical protein
MTEHKIVNVNVFVNELQRPLTKQTNQPTNEFKANHTVQQYSRMNRAVIIYALTP